MRSIDRAKIAEWGRRYLPCEIGGTVAELGGAALTYRLSGSFALAALVGTIGASVGYYAIAFVSAVRWSYRDYARPSRIMRTLVALWLATRSVLVEFGPAEAVDSLLVRPVAYYLAPHLFDSPMTGWIVAKVMSDIAFYVCAISSYERFSRLVVHRRSRQENEDESVETITAA